MTFLIVNNGSKYIPKLLRLLDGYENTVVSYAQLQSVRHNDYDGVILSGGHTFPVVGNESIYADEIALIRTCEKPLLGICLGFELIAYTYNASMEYRDVKIHELVNLNIVRDDPLFYNVRGRKIFSNHYWVVTEANGELSTLATSTYGVEVLKVREKPVYGIQFHPEVYNRDSCGDEIFRNFLTLVSS